MSLLNDLPVGAFVGLDTSPFIYYIEGSTRYSPVVRPLFEQRLDLALNSAVTSTVSLAESLVRPLNTGRADLVQRYRDVLQSTLHLTLADVTLAVAERAADLRSRYNLRLLDAFQVSAALEHGATHFITNDLGLRRVTALQVLVLDDYAPPVP